MTEQDTAILPSAAAKDPLLQPFKLKHLRLKNRVMSTSHAIAYQVDGKPKERYQLYHEEKARGGIALTMFGGSSNIAPDSPSVFGQLYVGDDSIIPYFEGFADRIHRHGCALMCQITHMGRRTSPYTGDWLPIVGPSRVREPLHRGFPKEMDEDDISRIVAAYGAAARRCKQGGLDGCEVVASGHLIGQFLSPFANRRSDPFGGSLANRARFGLMVCEEIRRQAGLNFIVGLRMSIYEGGEEGLNEQDCLEVAQLFEASGTIDFFNFIYGRMDTQLALAEHNMPGMSSASAPFLEKVGLFRKELSLPVFHAARITDVATARHAIRDGLVDMVGMTRAHIADPHLVNKVTAGEEHRVRPCVGATYCMTPQRVCIHNAAIGREARLPHVIEPSRSRRRRVVIVGGGPAGLEAARVSALRGHTVVVHEAASRLGGQVVLAAKASWRGELLGIVQWLAAELDHLGVTVHTNSYAETDTVLAEEPDVVIVATGGLPDFAWADGADLCVSVWDILSGSVSPGESVLVYDGTGQQQAASCADHLAVTGALVELVTPDTAFGMDMGFSDQVTFKKRLYQNGAVLTYDHKLLRVEKDGNGLRVILANTLSDQTSERVVDQVIVEHGSMPLDELYHALIPTARNCGRLDLDALVDVRQQGSEGMPGHGFDLYRVGDAVASRNIHAAILDSLRLCITL